MLIMKTITEENAMRMLNPVHPGRFLRTEIIEAHDLSVTNAAKILHVSRPTLSCLLNAKAGLSGDMALRFEKRSASIWIPSCGCRVPATSPEREVAR